MPRGPPSTALVSGSPRLARQPPTAQAAGRLRPKRKKVSSRPRVKRDPAVLPSQAKERKKALQAHRQEACEGEGSAVLRNAAVQAGTLRRYHELLARFDQSVLSNLGKRLQALDIRRELDQALAEFMTELYWDGEGAHVASATLAAVGWQFPAASRFGDIRLPQSRQMLSGFIKLSPARTRLPLPIQVISLIGYFLVRAGHRRAAIGLWLAVTAYLRPGEMMLLTAQQVLPPSRGNLCPHWSLLLNPFELLIASKTGQYNDTVWLDNPHHKFLLEPLAALKQQLRPEERLVDLSHQEFNAAFHEAARRAGLQALHPVPYHARHSGASFDLVANVRSLEQVKRRGRWMTDSCLNRYLKGGRLGEQFDRLSPAVQRNCCECHARIGAILAGRWLGSLG